MRIIYRGNKKFRIPWNKLGTGFTHFGTVAQIVLAVIALCLTVKNKENETMIKNQQHQIDTLSQILGEMRLQTRQLSSQNQTSQDQSNSINNQLTVLQKTFSITNKVDSLKRVASINRLYQTSQSIITILNRYPPQQFDLNDPGTQNNLILECLALLNSEIDNQYLLEHRKMHSYWRSMKQQANIRKKKCSFGNTAGVI